MSSLSAEIQGQDVTIPCPHFSDEINHNIIQSEMEGGVWLRDLPCGSILRIETQDWTCTLIYCGDDQALIRGHAQFCPGFVSVQVAGSTWGGSMIKQSFIGRGMHLEFLHPRYGRLVTSFIVDIQERDIAGVRDRVA